VSTPHTYDGDDVAKKGGGSVIIAGVPVSKHTMEGWKGKSKDKREREREKLTTHISPA
jgi:hypothetical protein